MSLTQAFSWFHFFLHVHIRTHIHRVKPSLRKCLPLYICGSFLCCQKLASLCIQYSYRVWKMRLEGLVIWKTGQSAIVSGPYKKESFLSMRGDGCEWSFFDEWHPQSYCCVLCVLLINKETPQRGQRGRNSVSGACVHVTFLSFEMSGAISALWSSESNARSRSRVAVYRLCFFFWLLSVFVTRWHVCRDRWGDGKKGCENTLSIPPGV